MNRAAVILIFVILFAGCREELEPKPLSYSKLLTGENSKSWQLTAIQFTEDERILGTIALDPESCDFDDLYIFYADESKTFVIDEGNSVCNEGDPQIYLEDTWRLVNATATIEMVIPVLANFRYPFILRDLNEKRMIVEVFFEDNKESYRMVFAAVGTN